MEFRTVLARPKDYDNLEMGEVSSFVTSIAPRTPGWADATKRAGFRLTN